MAGEDCKLWLYKLSTFLSEYRWLLDSYIIEFFTESHWSKLPWSWRESLMASDDESLMEIAQLIFRTPNSTPACRRVYPLSFLSFVTSCHLLSTPSHVTVDHHDLNVRPQVDAISQPHDLKVRSQVDGISHLFRKHVKPKKQHEIKCLGKVVFELCQRTSCRNVVDIGSGQGHLARYLAYHYGLDVTAVEAVGGHIEAATKFDREVERELDKKKAAKLPQESSSENKRRLRHIKIMVQPDAAPDDLLTQIITSDACTLYPSSSSSSSSSELGKGFIITGLHTCGDLAPTILRLFSQSKQALGLVSVGCCYMKLTPRASLPPSVPSPPPPSPLSSSPPTSPLPPSPPPSSSLQPSPNVRQKVVGYPMSHFVGGLISSPLSYEARELACHSFDAYRERLKEKTYLKIHCHRAVVETLLRKNGLRKAQIRISKRVSKLPFRRYAEILLNSVASPSPLVVSEEDLEEMEGKVAREWRWVAVFFMLRQALAPCVEKMLLLDRRLYLLEQGYKDTHLYPIFNSALSPRNIVLVTNS